MGLFVLLPRKLSKEKGKIMCGSALFGLAGGAADFSRLEKFI